MQLGGIHREFVCITVTMTTTLHYTASLSNQMLLVVIAVHWNDHVCSLTHGALATCYSLSSQFNRWPPPIVARWLLIAYVLYLWTDYVCWWNITGPGVLIAVGSWCVYWVLLFPSGLLLLAAADCMSTTSWFRIDDPWARLIMPSADDWRSRSTWHSP